MATTDDNPKDLVLSTDNPPVRKTRSKVLKPLDVCEIIKACYSVNVKRLSYDGLVIEFSHSPVEDHKPSPVDQVQAIQSQPSRDESGEIRKQLFIDETELLDVEDPVTFEQYAIGAQDVHLGKPGEG